LKKENKNSPLEITRVEVESLFILQTPQPSGIAKHKACHSFFP
jgi:hypothetical protein